MSTKTEYHLLDRAGFLMNKEVGFSQFFNFSA